MILVTGGTGFLGHDLVEVLIERGAKVRILTRRSVSDARIDVVNGDVSDLAAVERAMKDVKAVFHLAANSDHFAPYKEHYKTTVLGTMNVFKAAVANGVKKIVYMSSAAVTTKNKTNYTRAKAEAEDIAKSYWDTSRNEVSAVHGERMFTSTREAELHAVQADSKSPPCKIEVPIVRASLIYDETTLKRLARLSWLPFPYKRQRIHLSYKRCVIGALIGALKYGHSGVYTVADKSPILLTQLYKALARPRPMLWIPPQIIWLGIAIAYPIKWIARITGLRPFVTPEFIRYTFEDRSFDVTKAAEELKYSPVDTLEIVELFKRNKIELANKCNICKTEISKCEE